MTKWDFTGRIEDMTEDQLLERVTAAYEAPMPEIAVIPYVGNTCAAVRYVYKELVALCPMTGIQDLYEIVIDFTPDKYVPELKSLRFYFLAYRDLPISHEHLASKIEKDFKDAVQPDWLAVKLHVAIRGGIKTIVEV